MLHGRYLTMASSNHKPKKSEFWRRAFDFIFGFENKRGDVLDYQMSSADGFNYSSQEFYTAVEQEIEARKLPGLEITRQEFAEGGILTDKRIYLRLMRERLAITTCAAPFGNIFFFSTRTIHIPALVRLWHILAALAFLCVVVRLLIIPLGLTFTIIAIVALMFALAAVMRNASAAGFSDLDGLLLKIPVVATIYEDWFREETFYREDTRNLYLKIVPKLIEELAEDACAAKGVKLEPFTQPSRPVSELNKPADSTPKSAT